MKIYRTKDLDKLIEQAIEFNNKKRYGLHVSDLVYCLRKAYYRKKGVPEEVDFTSKLAMRLGAIHHRFLEFTGEREVENFGVVGHIDSIYDELPVEWKTTRSFYNGRPSAHYLKQLAYYLVLSGKKRGYLCVCYMNAKNQKNGKYEPVIDRFKVILSQEEYQKTKKEILAKKEALEKALKNNGAPKAFSPAFGWECKCCGFKKCPLNPAPARRSGVNRKEVRRNG